MTATSAAGVKGVAHVATLEFDAAAKNGNLILDYLALDEDPFGGTFAVDSESAIHELPEPDSDALPAYPLQESPGRFAIE